MARSLLSWRGLQNANRRLLLSSGHVRTLQWQGEKLSQACVSSRHLHDSAPEQVEKKMQDATPEPPANEVRPEEQVRNEERPSLFQTELEEYKKYFHFPEQTTSWKHVTKGRTVTIRGFLSSKRIQSKNLAFADISVHGGPTFQAIARAPHFDEIGAIRSINVHSPVSVTGVVEEVKKRGEVMQHANLKLLSIQVLNPFPKDIIVSQGAQFPPNKRHLQLRFNEKLQSRLAFRSSLAAHLRKSLDSLGLTEYETPILFKSTPEGAREFLVPTRKRGAFYALPQSPQQYKQVLMASGMRSYYQFARCFRDEDLRADRQPEFTQLDMEMGFATGEDVMQTVEKLIQGLPQFMNSRFVLLDHDGRICPVDKRYLDLETHITAKVKRWHPLKESFPRITYQEAMTRYGVDKPDTRIPFEIRRVEKALPDSFTGMITDLESPAVEAFKFRPNARDGLGRTPPEIAEIFYPFMESLLKPLSKNRDGPPTMLVVDSSKPLQGLSSLGHEGHALLTSGQEGLEDFADLQDGDVLFFQARPNEPFHGGSTAIGTLRSLVYAEAVNKGLLPRNIGFNFLWVTHFPMFTPDSADADPGQGGKSGFSATHHPFTAPLAEEDFELLATDPLKARADHYDLVVNGVELGGGSRRIHVAGVQEYVFRDILGMTDEGVKRFAHLLEALRAGCPPHAGFALGFDRLVAVLSHTDSVREVIAFPKNMKGEDNMVGSPGRLQDEELKDYWISTLKREGDGN